MSETAISLKEAAERLGVSYQTVWQRRHKIAFRLPDSRIWRVWPSQLAKITQPNYNVTRIASVGDRRTQCQSDNVKVSGTSISMRRAEKELDTLLARRTKKPPKNITTA